MLTATGPLFIVLYFIHNHEIFVAKPLSAEKADIAFTFSEVISCEELTNWRTMKLDFLNNTHVYRWKFKTPPSSTFLNFKIKYTARNKSDDQTTPCISTIIEQAPLVDSLETYKVWTIVLATLISILVLVFLIIIFIYRPRYITLSARQ